MVCLDVGNKFADNPEVIDLLVTTMYLCPARTVVIINLIIADVRSNRIIDKNALVDNLPNNISEDELKLWNPEVSPFCYSYNNVGMISYVFFKIGTNNEE